jgi:hypothetical protein
MLRLLLFVVLWTAQAAAAQSRVARVDGWEIGLRYWYSEGRTQWSHNAQGTDPSLGNPTSILTYTDLKAHALELHARRDFAGGWFVRGNAGLGSIRDGSFDDEDYDLGQIKFSDSISPVKGNRLAYGSVDVGANLWTDGRTTFGVFAGRHVWWERLDAYGVSYTVNLHGAPSSPESVASVSNDAVWDALRLGATLSSVIRPKTRFSVDLAWLPYARLRNEDSHWLRRDFGPAPNVFINGRGRGVELDLELRHELSRNWEAGVGLRHWWIEARKADVSTITFSAPLVEFESRRTGFTLDLTRHW